MSRMKEEFTKQQELKELYPPTPDDSDSGYNKKRLSERERLSELFSQYDIGKETRESFIRRITATVNAEWVEWIENHFATCIDECEEEGTESGRRFIRTDIWEARKKEINQ